MKSAAVFTAEETKFERKTREIRDADATAYSLRLPAGDIADLRFLWGALESRVGLRSTMGAQLENLAQRSHGELEEVLAPKARKPKAEKRATPTPAEVLEASASVAEAQWLAGLPAHVQASITAEELPVVKPKRKKRRAVRFLNGVICADGYEPQTIHVGGAQHGGSMRKVPDGDGGLMTSLFKVEEWCDPRNYRTSQSVRRTRAALARMDGDLVVALHAMYGCALPPSEFPLLGDLAPLVVDVPFVLDHAERMTESAEGLEAAGFLWRVSPREAARALTARRSGETNERRAERERNISRIKTEAHQLLITASKAYRSAKDETR